MSNKIKFSLSESLAKPHMIAKTKNDKYIKKYINKFICKNNNIILSESDVSNNDEENNDIFYWHDSFYQLDKSDLFKKLNIIQQQTILSNLTNKILSEIYYIEKAGINYSAKMILCAETAEEAMIYAHVSSDEAKHLSLIKPFCNNINNKSNINNNYFLKSLITLVEETPAKLLPIVIQVILEGWGLNYYKLLKKCCNNEKLQQVFDQILKDEALHFMSAEQLYLSRDLNNQDYKYIKDCFKLYLEMVRIGDHMVVSEINNTVGGLNKKALEQLYNQINSQESAANKLNLLANLMNQPGLEKLVKELDDEGYLIPYSNYTNADSLIHESYCK